MVIGVDAGAVRLVFAQCLPGQVGNHFVGVHVGGCTGAGLEDADDEMFVIISGSYPGAGGDDGIGGLGVEVFETLVGSGCRHFYQGQAQDKGAAEFDIADGEIESGAFGAGTPEGV